MEAKVITDERRCDMLVGAIEGGSNYWYNFEDLKMLTVKSNGVLSLAERIWETVKGGVEVPVFDVEADQDDDIEDRRLGFISLANVKRGEEIMAKDYSEQYNNIIEENDDAETADIWFQLVVMGELVYG